MGQQDTFAGFCAIKFCENDTQPILVCLIDENLNKIEEFSVSSFKNLGNKLYNKYQNKNFIFLAEQAESIKTYILEQQEKTAKLKEEIASRK